MAKFAAVVLSAGSGRRMNSEIPKQYLPLAGKPVIYHSLKAFEESAVSEIVLVAGSADLAYCREEIIDKYQFQKVKAIVPGGAERYDSVFEGLKAIADADYVLIHDGARPLLTGDIIRRSMQAVEQYQACTVGMPVKDTIKVIDGEGYAVHTPDRNSLWMIQTPQTFSFPLICQAYEKAIAAVRSGGEFSKPIAEAALGHGKASDAGLSCGRAVPPITDDAMVMECFGNTRVKVIEGSYENIKITTPEDLVLAEKFFSHF